MNKLLELLNFEATELSQSFRKASVSGRGTSQEVADLRENALRSFLSRYFPFPYRVAKGNIIDSFGAESPSIDCVLLAPNHPHTIDPQGKHTVIIADGVHAAIELKPDLQDTRELHRGLEQIRKTKVLRRRESSLVLAGEHDPALRELSLHLPSFIFADHAAADPVDTARGIMRHYVNNNIPDDEQVDFVVVNQKGILANYKHKRRSQVRETAGMFWEPWGGDTLAAFLLKLCWVDPPETLIQDLPLRWYLTLPTVECPVLLVRPDPSGSAEQARDEGEH